MPWCKTQECKDNEKTKRAQWRAANREKANASGRLWYSRNHHKARAKQLKYIYGITVDTYQEIFELQGGRCAICGIHQSQLKRRLAVDHDHETGQVRGLLCSHCNRLLGQACDEVATLQAAINYLKSKEE